MADFNEPSDDIVYTDFTAAIRDAIESVALMFNGTDDSNIPEGAIGWDSTNLRPMIYSSSAWEALLDIDDDTTPYNIRVAIANEADYATTAGTCSGTVATADLATNATNLGGVASSAYTLNTDIRGVAYGGTGASTAAGARTNLSVYAQSETYDQDEVDAALALKANLASPSLTGTPTAPTAATGTGTTQLATTAFVQQEITAIEEGIVGVTYGSPIYLDDYETSYIYYNTNSYAVPVYQGGAIIAVEFYLNFSIHSQSAGTYAAFNVTDSTLVEFANNGFDDHQLQGIEIGQYALISGGSSALTISGYIYATVNYFTSIAGSIKVFTNNTSLL